MKIELSKELTKKALEIGATHAYMPNEVLYLFRQYPERKCFQWWDTELEDWFDCEGNEADWVFCDEYEIDFDPPKSELLAEIEMLKRENAALHHENNELIITIDMESEWV